MRCSASFAISGIICIPEDPVPKTATFNPLKSIFSFGHLAECKILPLKFSILLIFGVFGLDRHPTAVTTNLVSILSPFSKTIFHLF